MPRYSLARHVFVCLHGEHVVFLDVRNDRYFALESGRTAGLAHLVSGWPVPAPLAAEFLQHGREATAPALAEQVDHGELSSVTALLLDKGILVVGTDNGKAAAPTMAEPVRADLAMEVSDEPLRIGALQVMRFISAAVRAKLLLKYRSFDAVVERVRRRGERARRGSSVAVPELHSLVAAFAKLRPLLFAARDACLFDALALSEFLAGYYIYPRWVFGVQARPFAAHCWMQLDGVVLNDTVDHVQRYTPIMVV